MSASEVSYMAQAANLYNSVTSSQIFQQTVSTAKDLVQKTKDAAVSTFDQVKVTVEKHDLPSFVISANKIGYEAERALNFINSLPVICGIGSTVRIALATLQVIAGLATAAIGEIGLLVTTRNDENAALVRKWELLSKTGIEHVIHGCLNYLRGTAEGLLASWTFGLGNVVLIIPNAKKDFAPHTFNYGQLTNPLLKEQTPAPVKPQVELPAPQVQIKVEQPAAAPQAPQAA